MNKEFLSQKFDESYFEGIGSKYKNGYKEPDMQKHYLFFTKYLFKKLDNKNFRSLEIGCAFGYGIKQANEIGIINAYGIDISVYAISHGTDKGISNLFVYDLNTDEIDLGIFDLVFACEVLEHLDNPVEAVRKICKTMRAGSYLYISLPMSKKARLTDKTHISIFPSKFWLDNFQSNQLQIYHLFYCPICLDSRLKNGIIKNFYNLLPDFLKKYMDLSISRVYGLYAYAFKNHLYVILKRINENST